MCKPTVVPGWWLGWAMAALLVSGASGCGTSSGHTTSPVKARASPSSIAIAREPPLQPDLFKADLDRDNDVGQTGDDTSHSSILSFGHPAAARERQAIETLLTRYYKAALAKNGGAACSMLYSTLAESIAEDYGSSAGPLYMRGTTCHGVMTLLFRHLHPILALELPKLRFAHVLVREHHGVVLLHFGSLAEREIHVQREARTWRVSELLDEELP